MDLQRFDMYTFELLAEGPFPTQQLRLELRGRGFDGWTETASVGYWRGERVDGQTTFTIATTEDATRSLAAALLQAHMDSTQVYQLTRIAPDGARALIEVREGAE